METFFIYSLSLAIAVFLLYFLGVAVAPYKPDAIKNDSFECGMPSGCDVPKKANFGFFMYAIMFIVADMTGLFFTLFVYSSTPHTSVVAALFGVIMAVAVILAMKEHRYVENS
jgi:NADH-quinone oxidoreductase subunit A